MANTTALTPETPNCECGALPVHGQIRCRKCMARDRFAKHEKSRRRRSARRNNNRRPPKDSRKARALGVPQ